MHCAHELPEPGMGFLVSLADRSKVGVAVKPRIIKTPLNGIEYESSQVINNSFIRHCFNLIFEALFIDNP